MHIYYNQAHTEHTPPHEIFNGDRTPHQEVLARIERIVKALAQTTHHLTDIRGDADNESQLLEILHTIHDPQYVQFLQRSELLSDEYVYPSVFPYRTETTTPSNEMAQRGYYSFDLFTPLSRTTYQSALQSAYLAMYATEQVLQTQQTHYALCRPPGHHAEPNRMGGYCYFNNGAVAAQVLRNNTNEKVAILDVDFHHGNGAEKIFGQDENVLTISIHADPEVRFPYFSGNTTDQYVSNSNYPLPLGTTDAQYQAVLEKALQEIKDFGARSLVVSYGADTHKDDPIGGFALSTDYYAEMAQQIANLQLPTVILQEGGYNTDKLGLNVVSFLSGF